jgi:hypothetical protein
MALRDSQTRARTLARMSHELRTPLNAILGCTQLLQADEDADPVLRRRRLAEIEGAGRELLALVDRVLDLTAAPAPPVVTETADTARDETADRSTGPTPDAATEAAAGSLADPPDQATHGTAGAVLLYIEDNEVNAMIVRELVARRGDIELLVAETGLQGLQLAAERQPAWCCWTCSCPTSTAPRSSAACAPTRARPPCPASRCRPMHARGHRRRAGRRHDRLLDQAAGLRRLHAGAGGGLRAAPAATLNQAGTASSGISPRLRSSGSTVGARPRKAA